MLGTVNKRKILFASGLLMLKIATQITQIEMLAIGSISAVVYISCPKSRSESSLHRSRKVSCTTLLVLLHILKYMTHFVMRENNTIAWANCRHTGGGAYGFHVAISDMQNLQYSKLFSSLSDIFSWTQEVMHSGVMTKLTARIIFVSVRSLICERRPGRRHFDTFYAVA